MTTIEEQRIKELNRVPQAPEGKDYWVKNPQYATPEPKGKPAPSKLAKIWKETIK